MATFEDELDPVRREGVRRLSAHASVPPDRSEDGVGELPVASDGHGRREEDSA